MKENKIYVLLGRYMIKLSNNKSELFTFLKSDVMMSSGVSCRSLCEAKESVGVYKQCLLCMRFGNVTKYDYIINLLPNHVSRIHHSLPSYRYHVFTKTSLYGSRIASKLLTTGISNINSHELTII